jgi:hypothetical protein
LRRFLIFNISLNSTPNQNITEAGDSQTRMRRARRVSGDFVASFDMRGCNR